MYPVQVPAHREGVPGTPPRKGVPVYPVVSTSEKRPSAHRRGYTRAWRAIAAEAIRRQPWCSDCGSTTDLTADHEIPITRGGLSTIANAVVRCRPCNSAKRDRLPPKTQLTLDAAVSRSANSEGSLTRAKG